MTGTGLKKWSPPNLSFLSTELAISVMEREEVFEAKIVELEIGRRGMEGGGGGGRGVSYQCRERNKAIVTLGRSCPRLKRASV